MGFRDWLFGTKKQELKEAVSYGYLPGVPASGMLDFWNYRPDQDGFLPVGFYRKRSKLGDNPQAFLDGEQLRMSRETSRNLCVINEYARNGLTNRRNYIVGTGFKTIAEPREGSTANEAIIKQVNDFLMEFAAVNKRAEKEKEAVFRGDRDGEVFLRLFFDDGVLKFRFVEPEYVGDWDGQTPFGIKTDPKDITNVLSYLIRYDDSSDYETVPADEIIHVKLNSDSGIKRGLPFLYPVFGILRKIESTNENMATNVAIMSAIAMIRKNPFKSRSAIDSNNSSNADYTAPRMPGGGVNNYRNYPPGSILDTDGMTEYEFPANSINLGGVVAVKESLLQTAASGMGLPEYMLTSDCSNGNLSTTQVGESPMILGMQAQQHMWGDYFGQGVYVEGAEHGLSWRAIEHAIEVGRLPQDVLLNIQLKFEGPNVVVRDRIQETQRLQILADEGIISRDSWAQKEGEVRAAVSDEDMQAKKDAETQATQSHELNMVKAKGQQPAGLKEEFEEDLHPRDDDGKFTTKGGGGDKGKGVGTAREKQMVTGKLIPNPKVELKDKDNNLTISGDTKAVKDALKSKGWVYNPEKKRWFMKLVKAHAQRLVDGDEEFFKGLGGNKKGCVVKLNGTVVWQSKSYGQLQVTDHSSGSNTDQDGFGWNNDAFGNRVKSKQIPGSAPDDRI